LRKLSRRAERRVVFMLSNILLLIEIGPEERVLRIDGGVALPSSLVSCSDEEETLSGLA
jgi:hypothetical protein